MSKKLLFVDTNIWLDFYRARTEAGLSLLEHLDKVSSHLIVSYQLEMEFKRNRQAAILEGFQVLKGVDNVPRPGIFSDAKAVQAIQNNIRTANSRVKILKDKLKSVVEKPSANDPVFKVFDRLMNNKSDLLLTRNNSVRHTIRRRALRRFLHGCPPRKKNDTSFGDAFNWEWMVECAKKHNAELIIVSRDADYGITYEETTYLNDHLQQEFSERVAKRKKILLYTKLSEALKHFEIPVTRAEELEEDLISSDVTIPLKEPNLAEIIQKIMESYNQFQNNKNIESKKPD